jgi:hypothetical protein
VWAGKFGVGVQVCGQDLGWYRALRGFGVGQGVDSVLDAPVCRR